LANIAEILDLLIISCLAFIDSKNQDKINK